jgi:hypothetical protein
VKTCSKRGWRGVIGRAERISRVVQPSLVATLLPPFPRSSAGEITVRIVFMKALASKAVHNDIECEIGCLGVQMVSRCQNSIWTPANALFSRVLYAGCPGVQILQRNIAHAHARAYARTHARTHARHVQKQLGCTGHPDTRTPGEV